NPSFGWGCTPGESWFGAVQLLRVWSLGCGQGGALPPDQVTGESAHDAVRSAATDHPAGPHASARIVWRAVTIVPNALAPPARRMISVRAWLTTRPGRPIRWKRS